MAVVIGDRGHLPAEFGFSHYSGQELTRDLLLAEAWVATLVNLGSCLCWRRLKGNGTLGWNFFFASVLDVMRRPMYQFPYLRPPGAIHFELGH